MLTFFERSPLDQVLKNDNVHKIQPSFQSPVKISGKSCREGMGRPGPAVEGRGSREAFPVHRVHLLPLGSKQMTQKSNKVGGGCYLIFMEQCFPPVDLQFTLLPFPKGVTRYISWNFLRKQGHDEHINGALGSE